MEISILKKDVPTLGFKKGDIHEVFPEEKIIRSNFEMIVKGRYPGLEFNKGLYKKYFTRYVKHGKSFVKDNDPSAPNNQLKGKYDKFTFIDRPKFESSKELKTENIIKDIEDNFPVIEHPYHTEPFWKFFNWGVSELSEIFVVIKIDDSLFDFDYRLLMIDASDKAGRARNHFVSFEKKNNLELNKKMSNLWNEKKNPKFKSFCALNFESHKHEIIEDYLTQNKYFPARYDLNFDLSIIEEK